MNNRYNTTKTPETKNEPVIEQATIRNKLGSVAFFALIAGLILLILLWQPSNHSDANKAKTVKSTFGCIEYGPARDAVEQYATNNPMPGKNKEDVIYAVYECMEDGPTRDALEEYVAQNPVDGLHQPICPERFDYKPRGYN